MQTVSVQTAFHPAPLRDAPAAIRSLRAHQPLDAPVAAAFASHWRSFAERRGRASCLPNHIGAFASIGGETPKDTADFVHLVKTRKTPAILLQTKPIEVPRSLDVVQRLDGVQMVLETPMSFDAGAGVITLGQSDAAQMLALAKRAKPGPFEINTHRLGRFIGYRQNGVLVAMAGQRMAFPGWIEISGVSVHPDFRGQGLARSLMRTMVALIQAAGARPFLHTFADNSPAIALYESLGFVLRSKVNIALVA